MIELALALALAAEPAPPDALEAAHARKDRSHVLVVVKADSAVEDMNKGTVTVFGERREYQCPGGELLAKANCEPCTYKLAEWAEHPDGEWIYDASFGNDEEHQAVAKAVEHFNKYFELEPRPGQERDGRQHQLFAYEGKTKAPPPPPKATAAKVLVGGKPNDKALIPAGSKEVEVEVVALAPTPAGALEPLAGADVSFAAPCAELKHTGPGRVLASLAPGTPSCMVSAVANPGGVQARFEVARQAHVEVLFEGQAADEVVVAHGSTVELTYSARALDKELAIKPQWKADKGSFELKDGGKRVVFHLDGADRSASVLLLDAESGASDTITVRRP